MSIDSRKWFDRTQPQTLQIATWLLYIDAVFALIDLVDRNSWIGIARSRHGALGTLVAIAIVLAYVGGAFLMANERKIGYILAVVAAFAPFVCRLWLLSGTGLSVVDRITGRSIITFIFEVALCALLLHPQSRNHQRIWFK